MERSVHMISIVVPCYNEEEAIPYFVDKTTAVLESIPNVDYELLFIDDGSHDATLSVLRKMSEQNERIVWRSFSRNFGKEAATVILKVQGIDKEAVGAEASRIRALRPVEPYHLYGIRYSNEYVAKKESKSGAKKK